MDNKMRLVVLTIRRAASKRENHLTGSLGVNRSTRYPIRIESATIVKSVKKRRWLTCLGRYLCSPGIFVASVCTSCIIELKICTVTVMLVYSWHCHCANVCHDASTRDSFGQPHTTWTSSLALTHLQLQSPLLLLLHRS